MKSHAKVVRLVMECTLDNDKFACNTHPIPEDNKRLVVLSPCGVVRYDFYVVTTGLHFCRALRAGDCGLYSTSVNLSAWFDI